MTLSHIVGILNKEITLEFRRKNALLGVVLFAVILVYLLYKALNNIERLQWDALLWIVVLFSGINAITKSFSQENNSSKIYLYSLYNPQDVIVAKVIYNFLFLSLLFLVVLLGFSVFIKNPIKDYLLFFQGAVLGLFGLSVIFTFISNISSHDGSNTMMMSIMSLPLTIPIVLLLIKITAVAMRLIQDSAIMKDLIMLGGIDLLLTGSVFILFEELWKD
jgi:heme exporter protein B